MKPGTKQLIASIVVWIIAIAGFGPTDLAFCRWLYYIYLVILGGITAIMIGCNIFIDDLIKNYKGNVDEMKIAFKKDGSWWKLSLGIISYIAMVIFLFSTPHIIAANFCAFMGIIFYIVYYRFRYNLMNITVDNKP